MTSDPEYKEITIHIFPNISRGKGNKVLAFGQLIECNKINIFLQKSCKENKARRLVPDYFSLFKKALYEVKARYLQLSFNIISIVLSFLYHENKLYKTLDYWSTDMLNSDFLEKGLVIVSAPHFVCDVQRNVFLKLLSINWPYFISLRYWEICDVINFEINLYLSNQTVFPHDP